MQGTDGTTKVALTTVQKNKLLKGIEEWDEKNEKALRIISFMISD